MRHITIQEISSKYPTMYKFIVERGRNNYQNMFFIDSSTEDSQTPTLYIMMSGRLYVTLTRHDRLMLRHVSFKNERELWSQALTEGHKAVETKYQYLAPVIDNTEIIWGLKPSNALF